MKKDSYHSMKRGLALSLAVHVIFLSWGAVQLINPVSLPQQLEAIPITLAPLTQEFSSKQGALNAPVGAIPAVKPTTKPQEKEEALHFGEGQVDSLAPFKPKEKPRLVETTPSLSGAASAEPSLAEEKKAPERPASQPKVQELQETKAENVSELHQEVARELVPEEVAETPQESVQKVMPEVSPEVHQEVARELVPEEVAETPQESVQKVMPEVSPEVHQEVARERVPEEVAETPQESVQKVMPEVSPEVHQEVARERVPEEVAETLKNEEVSLPQTVHRMQKMPVEQVQIRQQVPKVAQPDKSPLPKFKPKSAKKSPKQNAQTAKKQNQQMAEQTIEEILAMEEKNLFNRERTQGGGAKRSSEPEALGARKKINDTTKMAQTLVNMVGGCIQKKLKLVALGGDLKNRPVVRLRFYLNREGMVVGDPIIDPLSGEESQQTIMIRQVYAAVFSCQPYADLPRDQYDLWGQGFDFNVDPLQEITQ
ncbi:hypothetical protein [Bartonella gliris]|uniref:hypothetical protein n=1 Tax=Bartonella gliris TaxID=3004109 RepID=UPI00295E7828|nr:hypothetical protein [Bartonella gliris]